MQPKDVMAKEMCLMLFLDLGIWFLIYTLAQRKCLLFFNWIPKNYESSNEPNEAVRYLTQFHHKMNLKSLKF